MRIFFLLFFLSSTSYGAERQLTLHEQHTEQARQIPAHTLRINIDGATYVRPAPMWLNYTLDRAERFERECDNQYRMWKRFRSECRPLFQATLTVIGLGLGTGLGIIDFDASSLIINALILNTLLFPAEHEHIHF